MEASDRLVPHEKEHRQVVDEQLERTSNVGAIADATPSVAAPTKAEFDAVVAKLNSALQVLRDAGLIPAA